MDGRYQVMRWTVWAEFNMMGTVTTWTTASAAWLNVCDSCKTRSLDHMKTVTPAADSDPRQTGWPCAGGAASGVCRLVNSHGAGRTNVQVRADERLGQLMMNEPPRTTSVKAKSAATPPIPEEHIAETAPLTSRTPKTPSRRPTSLGQESAPPGDQATISDQAHQEGEVRGDQEEGGHCGSIEGADDLRRRRHGELRGGEDQGQGQEQPGRVSVLWKSLRDLQRRTRAWSARSLHVHVPPYRNRMAVRDGSCLRRAACWLWIASRTRFKGQLQASKTYCLRRTAGRGSFAVFETHIEQVSKANYKPPKRTFRHTETEWQWGTDHAFQG